MKKTLFLLFSTITFLPVLISQDSLLCKIIFYSESYRNTIGISNKIYINNDAIKMRSYSYYEYVAAPGQYSIYLKENPENVLRFYANAGETYYVRYSIAYSAWRTIPEVLIVDSISAYPVVYQTGMLKLSEGSVPVVHRKNRLGLNTSLGVGLDNIILATTNTGDQSGISFGGGYSIGLKYGYEFNKHLDLAFDINYQFSMLIPELSNATADFSRGNVSVTPSLIIPIKGGDFMRLKLGGGFDCNFAPVFNLDLSQLQGGYAETIKYKTALGYHFSLVYEINYYERLSSTFGLAYNNIKYKNIPSDNLQTSDYRLLNPNGSSIDLLFGLYFYF